MPGLAVKPRAASAAASSPAAATLPQCVHFTIEPVLADKPAQREAATPNACASCGGLSFIKCAAATVEPMTPITPGV